MKITKIRHKSGSTEIHYEKDLGSGKVREVIVKSPETPLPAFLNILMYLRIHLLQLMEMQANEDETKKVKVHGVSLDYSGDNEVMGVVIVGVRDLQLSRGVQVLNSPHKLEKSNDAKQKLDTKAVDLVYQLIDEAEKYVNGEVAQEKLDFPKDEKSAADVVKEHISKSKIKGKKLGPKKSKEVKPTNGKAEKKKGLVVKAKGKYCTVPAGFSQRLTELLAKHPENLQEDAFNSSQTGFFINGNGFKFERDGDVLHIFSGMDGFNFISNTSMVENVIIEIIENIEQTVAKQVESSAAVN
jgi:hypothetical protein